ncbi:transporter [Photobacterium rosenbergii]|uniref:Transporter n=1 Tax=Photobacterium rosenbergii TaxID=294936 RepID=A0A2T3NFA3_9GAMM|nr:TolC family protein [Photobacterium rosenbergii]PSW13256.1 transporter [Photobacterium rosenbergii]
MTKITSLAFCIYAATSLVGCTNFIPSYQQPVAPIDTSWPVDESANNFSIYTGSNVPGVSNNQTSSLEPSISRVSPYEDWRAFIQSDKLTQVIELALRNNRDVRIAILNIQRAEAQYGIQRANRLPNIDLGVSGANQRLSENVNNGNSTISRQYSVDLGVSNYEIDFWGRIQSLEQQALEQYLSTIEARKNTQLSLISSVVEAYLTLIADQRLLRLAEDTLRVQQDSLALTEKSFNSGVATGLDVSQAKTTVATALKDVALFTSQVNVDINALNILTGTRVPIHLLPQLSDNIGFAPVHVGVPSDVLLRRPDILSAEHQLRAANANIGAARAAYFPTISLTATGGLLSASADDLFSGDSRSWVFTPNLVLPIFNWGELDSQLDVSIADQQIALNQYELAIQTAFREVADALANQATLKDQVSAQQMLVDATGESFRLSNLRFDEGVDDYFTVLDSQREFYTAQQELINTKLSEELNLITLYKVLGGGWVETDVPMPDSLPSTDALYNQQYSQ